jgi:dimethylargininase
LTHLAREPIDVDRARRQHERYEEALRKAGCDVNRLAAGPDMPDSVFIEDIAIVVDEVAIVTRPGAASRWKETIAVAQELRRYREVQQIDAPGTIDGGDVLTIGRRVFIGRSSRTNEAGIEQMRQILEPFGYEVIPVHVRGCLHLKSAATAVREDLLLVNPSWVPDAPFAGFERIDTDPREPMAANALRVGEWAIYPTSFPRTLERLERGGVDILAVDVSELQKAEGAVTCCSLVFPANR